MSGQAQNFRKPNKESPDFRPSWQARSGTHSRQDTEDEGVARLKPRHESAKTTFRNDLLARYLLPNQLRYRQLRLHRPVKRVETETVITPLRETERALLTWLLPQGNATDTHAWTYGMERRRISETNQGEP